MKRIVCIAVVSAAVIMTFGQMILDLDLFQFGLVLLTVTLTAIISAWVACAWQEENEQKEH